MPSTALETAEPAVLPESVWRLRRAAHEARLDPYVGPHLERRRRGIAHPVHDFLFTYYAQRPAALRRWHPGLGVALAGPDADTYLDQAGYRRTDACVTVDGALLHDRARLLRQTRHLLAATAARPAQLGCFGMHEWAMVYRLRPDEVRHASWPLRLGATATDEVVESHRIRCTHFDAYRFFTDDARPLNTLRPRSDDRVAFEQPGCLHAGMDLYKHAYRLSPLVPSDVVADAFELAWDIRILDMRAAPYDLTGVVLDPTGEPWTPLPVETADGKQAYVEAQAGFAARAAPIRARLVEECERLLAAIPAAQSSSTHRQNG